MYEPKSVMPFDEVKQPLSIKGFRSEFCAYTEARAHSIGNTVATADEEADLMASCVGEGESRQLVIVWC